VIAKSVCPMRPGSKASSSALSGRAAASSPSPISRRWPELGNFGFGDRRVDGLTILLGGATRIRGCSAAAVALQQGTGRGQRKRFC